MRRVARDGLPHLVQAYNHKQQHHHLEHPDEDAPQRPPNTIAKKLTIGDKIIKEEEPHEPVGNVADDKYQHVSVAMKTWMKKPSGNV